MKRLFVLLGLVPLVGGCGGGGASPQPSSGAPFTTGAAVPEATKIAFMKACGTKLIGWKTLPKATQDAKLIAWAKTLKYIADAAIVPGGSAPYFLYTDGDSSVFYDNVVPPPVPFAPPSAPKRPQYDDQPGKTRAFCVNAFNPGEFEDFSAQLTDELNSKGYAASRVYRPTVSQILQLSGAGVVMWQGHGGLIKDGKALVGGALDTGEIATDAKSSGAYLAYRKAGELAVVGRLVTNANNVQSGVATYAITDKFVRNRLKFADNSLVCADSCTGATQALGQAFLAANAGTYVSWNADAGELSTTRFKQLFDRLLGDNGTAPISHPYERPFDMRSTQAWMQTKALDKDPSFSSKATLTWFKKPSYNSTMLLPTVLRVIYEAPDKVYKKSKYLIEGTFGPDPGPSLRSVKWGSTNCEVLSWDPNVGIKIKLLSPRPSGNIQVFKENRKSNEVPISEWTIPITYTLTGKGTLTYTVKVNAKIFADVHGVRFMPEDPLQYYPITVYTLTDTTGSYSASGSYKVNKDTTVTWSGSGTLKGVDNTFPADLVIFGGYFDVPNKRLNVTGFFHNATGLETVTGSSPHKLALDFDGFQLGFKMPYNSTTYAIAGGSLSALPFESPYAVSSKMSWGAATPVNPPDASTVH